MDTALVASTTGYPLLGLFWTMLILFGLALWFWLLFVVLGDLFARPDLGGGPKVAWTAALILLPLLGLLAYLVTRPGARERRPESASRGADGGPDRSDAGR